MKFSQRIGISPTEKIAQRESIDEDLKNGLWNALTISYWDTYREPGTEIIHRNDFVKGSNLQDLIYSLWIHFLKKPVDTIATYWDRCYEEVREFYFNAKWHELYDFIEFVAKNSPEHEKSEFIRICNFNLERENSAYRFVDNLIVEITSNQEIECVEEAIIKSSPFSGIHKHLKTALLHLSSRTHPDYRNSIKESISAIESLAKYISNDGKGTLGTLLKELERKKQLHPALKSSFSSLYGYTSDADGIRHALIEEENLTKADARFMLICCSAFINYIIDNTKQ